MNWRKWIRQIHRGLSIAFTVVVLAIFGALGLGKAPAQWVYYLTLFPLALLTFTGLYMFVLPYVVKQRSGQSAGRQE